MTDEQIKHMVNHFLGWKLPESFNPDGGIVFKKTFNKHTDHPMKHEPSGTNLFDADQAAAMVRHMIEELPPSWATTAPKCPYCGDFHHSGICPTIKAIEYFENGMVKHIEFKAAADYPQVVTMDPGHIRCGVTSTSGGSPGIWPT